MNALFLCTYDMMGLKLPVMTLNDALRIIDFTYSEKISLIVLSRG